MFFNIRALKCLIVTIARELRMYLPSQPERRSSWLGRRHPLIFPYAQLYDSYLLIVAAVLIVHGSHSAKKSDSWLTVSCTPTGIPLYFIPIADGRLTFPLSIFD